MSIIGLWKITDMNVIDMNFDQTWRAVDGVLADETVNPLQKQMAQSKFLFREDGRALQLMPKELDKSGRFMAYDDKFVISKETKWKNEGDRLFIAAEENGEADWQEIVHDGDGYVLFDMFKIAKA